VSTTISIIFKSPVHNVITFRMVESKLMEQYTKNEFAKESLFIKSKRIEAKWKTEEENKRKIAAMEKVRAMYAGFEAL
jgi:hypothetical protein